MNLFLSLLRTYPPVKTLAITCPLFVNDLDAAIEFYTRLLGQSVQRRFAVAAKGIEVARIGDVLLIGGPNEALAPLRAISATLRVDTSGRVRRISAAARRRLRSGTNDDTGRTQHDRAGSGRCHAGIR